VRQHIFEVGQLDDLVSHKALSEALTSFPTLTPNGFAKSLDEVPSAGYIDPEHVSLCIKWIEANMVLSTKPIINVRQSSYTLKHWVEKDYSEYVTNGAFICAAHYMGADIQIRRATPNPMFNLFMRKRRK
tara:strand:- start:305 stop:694 length:390 start_codon:yes stop_codon:yes gene_type:complete